MPIDLHTPSVFLVTALISLIGAGLMLRASTRWNEQPEAAWLAFALAQSFASFSNALREFPPQLWVLLGGNTAQIFALAALWLGARSLRRPGTPGWLALIPPAFWLGACTIPAILASLPLRSALIWLLLALLLAATAVELLRVYRSMRLRGALDLALVLGLVCLLPTSRLIELAVVTRYEVGSLTAIAAATMTAAVPFIALSIARERSQMEQAERDIAAQRAGRAEMDRLLAGLPAVVFLAEVHADGRFRLTYYGGDLEQVTGWPWEALDSDRSLRIFAAPETRPLAPYLQAALADGTAREEWRMRQPDGAWRHMRSSARRLSRRPDGGGEVVGYTLDVTAEREAMARVTASARLASLGEMGTGLAHELRQPLQVMSLAADIALMALADGNRAEAEARLEVIVSQVERTSTIIDHLRRFASGTPQDQPPGPVSLAAAVQGAMDLVARALQDAGIAVTIDLGSPAPHVKGHQVALEQVLVNLCMNARDAMARLPEGAARGLHLLARPLAGGLVQVSVADTGGGIPAAVMDRLFEPFVTTKAPDQGTGLGLSICHGLLASMGGSISARNGDAGAVLEFALPAA